jgi:hypothetical protein
MYTTCLFCNADLGRNEVIEHFPVGRRLAFDASKGRLWVVCKKCERWNLTPLEERWEAIEEAERLFSQTRLRASTDNIGLAKLREGLVLVRIGSALRPEMAAWRYGDQFGRRRNRHLLLTGAGVAAVAGLVVLGPVTGVIAGGGWGSWQIVSNLYSAYQNGRVRARLRVPGTEEVIPIRRKRLQQISIIRVDDAWGLRVPRGKKGRDEPTIFRGESALRAASKILPAVNERGAAQSDVATAVDLVASSVDANKLFARYAGWARYAANVGEGHGHVINSLPQEVRLAMEMATHEEQERRALEGELALLEAAWREAEEVAKISDDMFLPDNTDERLEEIRKRG